MTDLRKAAEMALEALEIWEKMQPNTSASAVRVPAIQALLQALNVDAVNMSQERVDETAKREHEPVAWVIEDGEVDYYVDVVAKIKPGTPLYTAPPKKEWVGLDGEIPGLGLVTEEFYNGMLFAEDVLREKNT